MSQKHLTINDINPDNYRYYVEKPGKEFNQKRAYATIKRVLDANDKMHKALHPNVEKNSGNVADILASFAKYKLDIGGGKQIEQWLGREWMKKIYGDRLLEKVRTMDSIRRLNEAQGNTMLGGNFYLK